MPGFTGVYQCVAQSQKQVAPLHFVLWIQYVLHLDCLLKKPDRLAVSVDIYRPPAAISP